MAPLLRTPCEVGVDQETALAEAHLAVGVHSQIDLCAFLRRRLDSTRRAVARCLALHHELDRPVEGVVQREVQHTGLLPGIRQLSPEWGQATALRNRGELHLPGRFEIGGWGDASGVVHPLVPGHLFDGRNALEIVDVPGPRVKLHVVITDDPCVGSDTPRVMESVNPDFGVPCDTVEVEPLNDHGDLEPLTSAARTQ